jgi:hypothetical protein
MQPWEIVSVIVAVVIVAALVWMYFARVRSRRLREHFGPEYDRAVAETGNRWRAESDLSRREQRVRDLNVRRLSVTDRAQFTEQWRLCQSRFVDDPVGALDDADRLVDSIMEARGYPIETERDRLANISAAYPRKTAVYREAREIAVRRSQGRVSTEDLRRAFVRYRELFDELLGGEHEEFKRAS